jgi:multidrug efflux pump subunit AcrA (membrane-fusion protein)
MKKLFPSYNFLKRGAFILGLSIAIGSCKSHAPAEEDSADVKAQTPVTVTTIDNSPMTEYIDVVATSTFLQKNYVKANATGYINSIEIQPGHYVNKGQLLFTIKTKEAQSIGNSVNVLDTAFKFSGINRIKAFSSGYITQLSHQQGDYVQDGEQLAVISDRSSFIFLMQLPYEYRSAVKLAQTVQLTLPDGLKIDGKITSFMPSVDTLSQTQGVAIRLNTDKQIPENLVAHARVVTTVRSNTISLPKSAILSNETQTEFWVMKLINPTTAVKTPIKKGIETGDKVEVLSPKFSSDDKIITTGNYGLADTAKVKIEQ